MTKSNFNTIEDIVRSSLDFKNGQNNNGWNKIYCEVCGDGKRTKGPRGGWRFEGEFCAYHCFNCGIDGNFDPTREIAYSTHMSKIFSAFGIPRKDITSLVFAKKVNKSISTSVPVYKKLELKTLEIPDHFYLLSSADSNNVIAENAREYLRNRFINPESYPYYLSTGISTSDDPGEISAAKYLANRIIIPSFFREKMVYYIARSLDPESKLPYMNANVPRSNVIYGFDKLYTTPKKLLFVTEGFFDAQHLDGVSVLENRLSSEQAEILDKSPRQKIVVPDNKGDSDALLEHAAKMDWGVSIPDIGDCKDITDGIKKYGKLYVIDSVMKNVKIGRKAISMALAKRRPSMKASKKA
jgi:hypothetical protein